MKNQFLALFLLGTCVSGFSAAEVEESIASSNSSQYAFYTQQCDVMSQDIQKKLFKMFVTETEETGPSQEFIREQGEIQLFRQHKISSHLEQNHLLELRASFLIEDSSQAIDLSSLMTTTVENFEEKIEELGVISQTAFATAINSLIQKMKSGDVIYTQESRTDFDLIEQTMIINPTDREEEKWTELKELNPDYAAEITYIQTLSDIRAKVKYVIDEKSPHSY